ncbi:hypothetical protein Tco_0993484, partial [Tanacetum coccineum]
SGSTTTHVDFSRYNSFIFDHSNDQFPSADRSDLHHEEFIDELAHIVSLLNLECFKFKIEPDPGDLTSIDPRIHKNVFTTNANVPLEDDQSSLFAYVIWIFLAFLTYPIVPPYILSIGNEDTIFDLGIPIYHSFMPDVSHRSGTFMKFNDCPDCDDSRVRGFVLRSLEFHILSFDLGIQCRISTKRRKTKPNWTKPSTEAERAKKSKSKVKPDKVKANQEKLNQKIQL